MSVVAEKPSHPKRKEWKKSRIKPEDYDFSKYIDAPPRLLMLMFYWEVDRELGSRKPAFLASDKCLEVAQGLIKNHAVPELIKHRDTSELQELINQADGNGTLQGSLHFSTVVPIEIDWSETDDELVSSFKRWLKKYPRPFVRKPRPLRKPKQFLLRLTHLAVYRLHSAGIKFTENLPKGYPVPHEPKSDTREQLPLLSTNKNQILKRTLHMRKQGEGNIEERFVGLKETGLLFSKTFSGFDADYKAYLTRDPTQLPF